MEYGSHESPAFRIDLKYEACIAKLGVLRSNRVLRSISRGIVAGVGIAVVFTLSRIPSQKM